MLQTTADLAAQSKESGQALGSPRLRNRADSTDDWAPQGVHFTMPVGLWWVMLTQTCQPGRAVAVQRDESPET